MLDLRDDPGGIVDQSIPVADQFLDAGTIVTIRGRQGSVENQVAHKGGAGVGVPVDRLVDQGTASAAEILAASLHDHGRAKLVGLPTYGKGTVQTFYDLDDGSGLKLTTARYLTPKGNSWNPRESFLTSASTRSLPRRSSRAVAPAVARGATIKDGRRRSDSSPPLYSSPGKHSTAEASSRPNDCFAKAWTGTTNERGRLQARRHRGDASDDVQAGDPGRRGQDDGRPSDP